MNISGMKLSIVVILLIVAFAVSVNAQKVTVGADPAVDLTTYKTYTWAKGPVGANPIIKDLIIAAVDNQLTAKGLKKVETEAELTLVALVWSESDIHVSNPSWAPGVEFHFDRRCGWISKLGGDERHTRY